MAKRYAERTNTPIATSKSQIQSLLVNWGCGRIGWADDYGNNNCTLQFVWTKNGIEYPARFTLQLDAPRGVTTKSGKDMWQRSAFRILYNWVKGALNAIESGIIDAEDLFMPWIIGPDGRTLGEIAKAELPRLLHENPTQLLLGGAR